MLDNLKNGMDTIENGMDTARGIMGTVRHAVNGLEYYTSEKRRAELRKANRIHNFTCFLTWFIIILWVAILITTIVLCATGNDAVLRFLSL